MLSFFISKSTSKEEFSWQKKYQKKSIAQNATNRSSVSNVITEMGNFGAT